MLGPQGSGKGTQAAKLVDRFGFRYVASGDVLRAARQSDTELGREVRRYYDAGELVPDDLTIRLILQEMGEDVGGPGVILDGFPRTLPQAVALDRALEARGERVDLALELTAPLDVVKKRLEGRLYCRAANHDYNTYFRPPRRPGVCDVDGSELYRRPDDYPEAIERRLAIWREQNGQLVEHYERAGVLRRVDADRPVEEVARSISALLERMGVAA